MERPRQFRVCLSTLEGTAMTISDIRTRIDALNERSCLITRTAEADDTPVLTLSILQTETMPSLA